MTTATTTHPPRLVPRPRRRAAPTHRVRGTDPKLVLQDGSGRETDTNDRGRRRGLRRFRPTSHLRRKSRNSGEALQEYGRGECHPRSLRHLTKRRREQGNPGHDKWLRPSLRRLREEQADRTDRRHRAAIPLFEHAGFEAQIAAPEGWRDPVADNPDWPAADAAGGPPAPRTAAEDEGETATACEGWTSEFEGSAENSAPARARRADSVCERPFRQVTGHDPGAPCR